MPHISYYPQTNEMIYHGWYQTALGSEGLTSEEISEFSSQIIRDLNNRILSKEDPKANTVLIAQTDELVIGTKVDLLIIFDVINVFSDDKLKDFGEDLREIFKMDRGQGRRYILKDHEIFIG